MLTHPGTITDEDRGALLARARREAEEDVAKFGKGGRWRTYTDGLGALGCGSWSDGPATILQAEYDRIVFGDS